MIYPSYRNYRQKSKFEILRDAADMVRRVIWARGRANYAPGPKTAAAFAAGSYAASKMLSKAKPRSLTIRSIRGGYRRRSAAYYRSSRKQSTMKWLVKRVKELTPAPVVQRILDSGSQDCALNSVAYKLWVMGDGTNLNSYLSTGYWKMDGTATAVNVTPNLVVNQGNHKFLFTKLRKSIEIKVNNNSACNIHFMWVTIKKKVNTSPITFCENALDHEGDTTSTFSTNPRYNLRMINEFNESFRIVKDKKVKINPGETMRVSLEAPKQFFDLQRFDEYGEIYRINRTVFLIARIQGDVCHDTDTQTNVGTSPCSFDYAEYTTVGYRIVNQGVLHREVPSGDFDTFVASSELINPEQPNDMEITTVTE